MGALGMLELRIKIHPPLTKIGNVPSVPRFSQLGHPLGH
jgi:hypothetical protein